MWAYEAAFLSRFWTEKHPQSGEPFLDLCYKPSVHLRGMLTTWFFSKTFGILRDTILETIGFVQMYITYVIWHNGIPYLYTRSFIAEQPPLVDEVMQLLFQKTAQGPPATLGNGQQAEEQGWILLNEVGSYWAVSATLMAHGYNQSLWASIKMPSFHAVTDPMR